METVSYNLHSDIRPQNMYELIQKATKKAQSQNALATMTITRPEYVKDRSLEVSVLRTNP